jgi:RimJ/RimL family protein N-acetyltransferase
MAVPHGRSTWSLCIMKATFASLEEAHFDQLLVVADCVARERRYLAMLEAPPPEQAFAFYRNVIATGQCHVALVAERVVGWCDILPPFGEARRHVGTLGMGLLPAFRGSGLGTQLLKTAVAAAWSRGLSRIELTVREDNVRARALYERVGFNKEGVLKNSMLVDGRYYDCNFMALLR